MLPRSQILKLSAVVELTNKRILFECPFKEQPEREKCRFWLRSVHAEAKSKLFIEGQDGFESEELENLMAHSL